MGKTIGMILGILVILLLIGLGVAGEFFYRRAVALNDKAFIGQAIVAGVYPLDDPWRMERMWYENANREILTIRSTDNLILSAIYLVENPDSKKVALLAHGYTGNLKEMAPYAKLYAEMGFNVLVPDARGHGESEGDYIGFGWHERKDYLQWIELMIEKSGKDAEIALFGISMGGATVMNVSGEPLPTNVKVIVEDCGYSSVTGELAHQLKEMYHLPAFPLVPITSFITKIRSNYWFSEASSVNQVKKNKVPMLFIHGEEDTFVPTKMLDEVYEANASPKKMYLSPRAAHAKSYQENKEDYKQVVQEFVSTYIS
ncbi:MAG: alpha/beta hydrolase [Carnobacterium sp.]|nr:alpha/beta hydrolase [Carnobacterium sp.]